MKQYVDFRMRKIVYVGIALLLVLALPAMAQDDAETEALAKAAQNPVSSLISLPFQLNHNFDVRRWEGGEWHKRNQTVLNIQPVYPVQMGNWNLINRAIIPILRQPIGRDDDEVGLGDIDYTLYFSPAEAGKVIWGAGPTIKMDTATDDSLGSGKWSAGAGVVVLTMPGRWVVGGLISNVWSFAGNDNRSDVNLFFAQPIINYNLQDGWYLVSTPVIIADWENVGDEWTVPIGGGFGKIFKIGKQPMNAQLQAFYNLERPETAGEWTVRAQLQFMFPKKPN